MRICVLSQKFISLQEKRQNREEVRLKKCLDHNEDMTQRMIPSSVESMDQNLPALIDKRKYNSSLWNLFIAL